MLMITRGGIVLRRFARRSIKYTIILTAAVDFPAEIEGEKEHARLRVGQNSCNFPMKPWFVINAFLS
jgi:hypothetical protein